MPFDGTTLSRTTLALMNGRRRIERGWCQGVLNRGDEVCAIGAMKDHIALEMLMEAHGKTGLIDWNDEPGRTKEDVLELYDRAIALSLNP